jgi:hypothetical protein
MWLIFSRKLNLKIENVWKLIVLFFPINLLLWQTSVSIFAQIDKLFSSLERESGFIFKN